MNSQYQELINNLNEEKIIELMTKLGANRYIEKEGYIIFPTICHNIDAESASMKLYYYKDNKFFYCYTNCEGMSIFNFLKEYYETRQYEYDWYEDIVQIVEKCSTFSLLDSFEQTQYISQRNEYQNPHKNIKLPSYPEGILNVFTKFYPPEWLKDNITEKAMDKFNILFSISQNKIIIPHYDIENNLVGIRGRALDEWEVENIGKYMPVKIENKWYSHPLSMNLYGLNKNIDNIRKNKVVYVFESEKSTLQLESFPIDNCSVAVCGSNFNKLQLNLLLKNCYPQEIIICFDKEEKPGEDLYFNKLLKICQKYKNYCNFSFIYDRENLLDLKDSPSDKGYEVFNKLLDRRVIV